MPIRDPVIIFWFRRDLRLDDNAALYHALQDSSPVLPLYIFDKNLLDDIEALDDSRISFIQQEILELNNKLKETGSSIIVKQGNPKNIWNDLIQNFNIKSVYANNNYEPYERHRDDSILKLLKDNDIPFHLYKDQVIFEKDEVLKPDQKPYTVFTPYSRRWKQALHEQPLRSYPSEKLQGRFVKIPPSPVPPLSEIGFIKTSITFPAKTLNETMLLQYDEKRNFPAENGTSRIGVHLRYGTISIRKVVEKAIEYNQIFLNELIWREFYQMILWHFPSVVTDNFNPKYDGINWRNNEDEFILWCEGKTGYPMVDAGIRQLITTGFMHNRVRMITASFLTKHLLIDWRWGEAFFAQKLLDHELASNNGGWQWAAGTGADAAPYFRIFNPALQQKKFDPEEKYIKQYIPELNSLNYSKPVVEHEFARQRAISVFKAALN